MANFWPRIAVRSPLEEDEKPDWLLLPIASFGKEFSARPVLSVTYGHLGT